jgi:hypothetical protein
MEPPFCVLVISIPGKIHIHRIEQTGTGSLVHKENMQHNETATTQTTVCTATQPSSHVANKLQPTTERQQDCGTVVSYSYKPIILYCEYDIAGNKHKYTTMEQDDDDEDDLMDFLLASNEKKSDYSDYSDSNYSDSDYDCPVDDSDVYQNADMDDCSEKTRNYALLS